MNCDLKIEQTIRNSIAKVNQSNTIVVWAKSNCPYCKKAKKLLNSSKRKYAIFYVDLSPYMNIYDRILKETHKTYPQIYINNQLIGGFSELQQIKL